MDTGPGGVLVFLQTANRDRGRGVLERMLGEVLNHVSIYMNHAFRFFQQQQPLQVLKTNCGPNVQRRLDGKYTLRRSETIGSPAKFRSPRDVDVRWLPPQRASVDRPRRRSSFRLHGGRFDQGKNTLRAPRVSLSIVEFVDPYTEVQIRWRVIERRSDPQLKYYDAMSLKYVSKPWPYRDEKEPIVLLIEVKRVRYSEQPFDHTPPSKGFLEPK